jgi:hypothetical protein
LVVLIGLPVHEKHEAASLFIEDKVNDIQQEFWEEARLPCDRE